MRERDPIALKTGEGVEGSGNLLSRGPIAGSDLASERFPGPNDFIGSYDSRLEEAKNGGQSTFEGAIVVTMLDRSLVKKVLPSQFQLAARNDGLERHPVIHFVGHQGELSQLKDGVATPIKGAVPYQEIALLVPFVVHGDDTKWHTFVVGMYLDSAIPVEIGNSMYAYAKYLASFVETGTPADRRTKVTPIWSPYVHSESQVTLTGAWRSSTEARTSLPRWRDLQTIFEMPILGVDLLPATRWRNVCSYWEWEYTKVEVAPAISKHQFYKSFPFREMEGWSELLSNAQDGAIALRGLRWRLSLLPIPVPSCF